MLDKALFPVSIAALLFVIFLAVLSGCQTPVPPQCRDVDGTSYPCTGKELRVESTSKATTTIEACANAPTVDAMKACAGRLPRDRQGYPVAIGQEPMR